MCGTYGAKGDGVADDTSPINQAMRGRERRRRRHGGARGEIPLLPAPSTCEATWWSRLGPGCALVWHRRTQRPMTPLRRTRGATRCITRTAATSHWHDSLIWGEDLVNVAITEAREDLREGTFPGLVDGGGSPGGRAARKAIALKNCRNVILRDFTIQRGGWSSASWRRGRQA